ncbi:DUF309 domain-containing protein [uncultured Maritimibacter sp.]|jgi:hypothetical protein|uniref:DUF309 domain-containing protein n=1 Tax=uncultured Maritimibacter sp. TaxID=991866 RepID=UPI000A596C6B|nr:DUF309 domain-containing protein [uncultured Maritimibacter sp.]
MNREPHIPGRNARPPEGSIAPGLDEGFALYHAGFFWEAHEAWEPVWMDLPPNAPEKAEMAALIQLANARLKLVMGKGRAVARILPLVDDHLARSGEGAHVAWARGERESLAWMLSENVHYNAK